MKKFSLEYPKPDFLLHLQLSLCISLHKFHLSVSHNIEIVTQNLFQIGFLKVVYLVNKLQSDVAYLLPIENIRKPKDILMFSGSIDEQHQTAMG